MTQDKRSVRELKGYRVRPNTHGWELQANYVYFDGKHKDESVWEAVGYYGCFSNAVAAVIDKKLATLLDGEEPVKLLEAIKTAFDESLKVANEFNVTLTEARKLFKTEE